MSSGGLTCRAWPVHDPEKVAGTVIAPGPGEAGLRLAREEAGLVEAAGGLALSWAWPADPAEPSTRMMTNATTAMTTIPATTAGTRPRRRGAGAALAERRRAAGSGPA